jgi:uncharacterized protein
VQLTRENTEALLIHAWEPGRIRVGDRWISGNLILSAATLVESWRAPAATEIGIADLAPALELDPEIIILGVGTTQVLPDVALMSELADRAIGLEVMTTPAACRTYNVLVHEARRVVAALLNPTEGSAGRAEKQ